MIDVAINVDFSDLEKVLLEYAAATDKSMAESVNRAMNNVAIKGVMNEKAAKAADINKLRNESWWLKYVAAAIAKQKGAGFGRKVFQAHYAKGQGNASRSQSGYVQYAKEFGDKILARRRGSVKFLKLFFVALSNKFAPVSGGQNKSVGRAPTGIIVDANVATSTNATASARVSFEYKNRSQGDADKASQLLQTTTQTALDLTKADIEAYTARKLDELSKRYGSGRV